MPPRKTGAQTIVPGAVLADGAPAEVLTPALLRAAYGVEARPFADPITGHLRIAVSD